MGLLYFKISEFACKCGCGTNLIDGKFVEKLDKLRGEYGAPLIISSGYRCPKHNAKVSSTGLTGPHTTGHAADIAIDRRAAYELLDEIIGSGAFTGLGFQQKGGGRFIHLDDLPNAPGQPRPSIWSY